MVFVAGNTPSRNNSIRKFPGYRARISICKPENASDTPADEINNFMLTTFAQNESFLQVATQAGTGSVPEEGQLRDMPITFEFLHPVSFGLSSKQNLERKLVEPVSKYWVIFQQVTISGVLENYELRSVEANIKKCRWKTLEDLVKELEKAYAFGHHAFRDGQYDDTWNIWWGGLVLMQIVPDLPREFQHSTKTGVAKYVCATIELSSPCS